MPLNNELTERIRSSLSIEDVIGRSVSLRPTHRGYSGLCPFHSEKTPSFHVYTDTQSYYCFGCHESGDIFTFIMKTQNLSYPEAISLLAQEAGIDVREYRNSGAKDVRSLYEVMNAAQEYFTSCMKRLPGGRAYLEGRGISAENIESFGLGYAPDSWDGLSDFLRHKGVTERMIVDAGLAIQNERGIYDRFRGRVIFPVRDIAGRIIAFGGRAILPDVGAKYINSPESSVYSKRRNLYMLNVAGSHIREKGYSILCEGYMDVIRLHMAGFRESVASLGTSLTAEQAGLLKRFSDRCCICYDSDTAGQKAALRGMYILSQNGLDVRVIKLPSGKDPDDFLRENPPELFHKTVNNALPLMLYQIETLRPELEDQTRRPGAIRELWECVKKIGADEALRYIASLSGAFMLPTDEVRRRILTGREITAREIHSPSPVKIGGGIECALCALLMRYRECRLSIDAEKIPELITDNNARITAEAILSEGADGLMDLWRTVGDTAKIGVIARGDIFLSEISGHDWREKWQKVIASLEALGIKRRIREIGAKMKVNAASLDEMKEFTELQRKLEGLRI